ncbi:hypothetical protein MK079_00330 [Candidatus Gracilibacteria bacterium]|nr:hypothetical protein [Candidatus Gracilibacteria bacterium]
MDSKVMSHHLKKHFSSSRKKQRDSFEMGVNSTYIILLTLMSILLLYYVWILNVNATKGYDIRELEREKQELSIQKELLEVRLSDLESLSNIESDIDVTEQMETVQDPEFLVIKKGVQYVYNY